jgi:hypothetical protein
MKTLLCAMILAALCACGGGDDEDKKTVEPVDCKVHPNLCV